MPNRTYVQVATDGSGKKVANISVTEPTAVDTSGNAQADTTTYQQLTTAVDKRGELTTSESESEIVGLLRVIAEQLTVIRMALE